MGSEVMLQTQGAEADRLDLLTGASAQAGTAIKKNLYDFSLTRLGIQKDADIAAFMKQFRGF
jgi:hypothetical protein